MEAARPAPESSIPIFARLHEAPGAGRSASIRGCPHQLPANLEKKYLLQYFAKVPFEGGQSRTGHGGPAEHGKSFRGAQNQGGHGL